MRTAVVILNWNTREYLRNFLPPLLESLEGTDAFVAVADNGSNDGSTEVLRSEFPSVRTLLFSSNLGFTGGNNRAVEELTAGDDAPEFVVLMNSDVLVSPGWLEPLIAYMDTHPGCGVCGPKLLKLNDCGNGNFSRSSTFEYAGAAGGFVDRYGFPFCRGRVLSRLENDEGQYDSGGDGMFWVSGACLLTRTSVWKALDGLDGRFFAHMEEIDYCWRAQLAAWSIACVGESAVWHLGGGTLPHGSARKLMLNYRNSLLMLAKNLPATVGPAKARRLLRTRRIIDNMAALAYLLSGHPESWRAVRQAHREADAMLTDATVTVAAREANVRGMLPVCIIFKYIKSCIS